MENERDRGLAQARRTAPTHPRGFGRDAYFAGGATAKCAGRDPLPDLLHQLCKSLIGRARLPIQLNVEGQHRLPPDVQIGFYRITQEALNNIVKHSKATQAIITLRLNGSIHLSIEDNGCGFEPDKVPPDHLGLKIMCERAKALGAKISIYSEPGEGTQISVTWKDIQEKELEL